MRRSTNPPAFARAMLCALLHPREREVISGDLLEEYRERAALGAGTMKLRVWYIRQVLSFVSAASLRRALLPGSVVWVATVALIEIAVFILVPELGGVPPQQTIFGFVLAVLACAGASVLQTRAARQTVFTASGLWMIPFLAVALFTLRLPMFTPVPGVVAFFACVTAAALHASRQIGKTSAGIAAGTVTGLFIAAFTAVATISLHHPHPPLSSFLVVPGVAAMLGVVGGAFGSRFGRFSTIEPALLSPRFTSSARGR